MTEDSWHHGSVLNADQFAAQRTLPKIQRFVEEFQDRNELSELQTILTSSARLGGNVVGQRPERFTEEFLIEPCLEALGYENIRARPSELATTNRKEPDYAVEADYEDLICLVEAKALTLLGQETTLEENSDVEQIRGYLEENFSTKYRTGLQQKYLVGILTDGVYWVLFGKPVGCSDPEPLHGISLKPTIERAIKAKQHPTQTSDSWRVEERNRLEADFSSRFSPNQVYKAILSEFSE
ncbi:hypothetical protein [Natranaeroarchaeum aerophilus]|uniref:Uncharacterized protein n=1 Tax=Natranaeroarchaeum aerophilus TaxID=2917711 RepID=A0AAE3FRF4_9EURY|nr:hypothetical protein [Natranaeroarchaeum aerophilus]MCL9813968.1 hypothetical protein [Natranaeroarchaeum aerophilus]